MAAAHTDDPELKLAPSYLLDDRVRVRDRQRDVHQWMLLLELAEDHGEHAPPGPGGRADLEPPLELALGLLVEACEQLLLEREQPLGTPIQAEPGLGRLDPAAGPVEEPLAHPLLERPDLQ